MSSASLILVVDDDEPSREATGSLVEALGFATESFGSAAELLESDLLVHAKCLIVDVHMPGMSGFQLQHQLKTRGQNVPVIFVTGLPCQIARREAVRAGAVGYLRKPVAAKRLLKAIQLALGGKSSARLH